jgi:sec-independent protein translocase protein TatA
MGISWVQILVVVVLLVLLFGRGRISSLMGDVASGIKSFRSGMRDEETDTSAPPVIEPAIEPVPENEKKSKKKSKR